MKKSSLETLNKILFALDEIPKSMFEISKKSSVSWEVCKNKLKELKELNLVLEIEKEDNKKNIFYVLNPNPQIKKKYGTYFNLPISLENKQKLENWYFHIKKNWFEIKGAEPNTTQIYKTLAKINKDLNLNLPFGWYNFGQIPLLIYKDENTYSNQYELMENEKSKMIETINKYCREEKSYKINRLHYEDFNKSSYIEKDETIKIYKKDFDNSIIIEKLKNLYSHLYNENISNYFNDYLFKFILLNIEIKYKKIELDESKKIELYNLFLEIWNFVTIDQYKISMVEFQSEIILDSCLKNKIENKKIELDEKFSEVLFNFSIEKNIFEENKNSVKSTWQDIENLNQDEVLKEFNF